MSAPLPLRWKVGDRVRFAPQHPNGRIHTVTALVPSEPMVEIEGMTRQFAVHLFVAVPCETCSHDEHPGADCRRCAESGVTCVPPAREEAKP